MERREEESDVRNGIEWHYIAITAYTRKRVSFLRDPESALTKRFLVCLRLPTWFSSVIR